MARPTLGPTPDTVVMQLEEAQLLGAAEAVEGLLVLAHEVMRVEAHPIADR